VLVSSRGQDGAVVETDGEDGEGGGGGGVEAGVGVS